MAQRPKEQIKTVLLVNFTKDEILNAKKVIWETCQSKLDKLVQRVDTSVGGAECANADDILSVLLKLYSTRDLPEDHSSAFQCEKKYREKCQHLQTAKVDANVNRWAIPA